MHNIDRMKLELQRYSDNSHSSNTTQNTILGIFVVWLALKYQFNNEYKLDSINSHDIENALWQFDTQAIKYHSDVLNLHINERHLYEFLYRTSSIQLNTVELIDVLSWITTHEAQHSLFGTPQEVTYLLSHLIDIKEQDTILDPAMGTGGFLAAIQRKKPYAAPHFLGVELNKSNYYVANLYRYFSNNGDIQLLQNNAFYLSQEDKLKQYDIIISNPPVQRIRREEFQARYPHLPFASSEVSVNFIEMSLSHLKPGGRAIFLVSMKILFAARDIQEIRRLWIERGLLKTVITLPINLLPDTTLQCAILIFERPQVSPLIGDFYIKLVKADDCYFSRRGSKNELKTENIQEIISRFKKNNYDDYTKNISIKELKENDFILLPGRYLEQNIAGYNVNLSTIWKPLKDFAVIQQGGVFQSVLMD